MNPGSVQPLGQLNLFAIGGAKIAAEQELAPARVGCLDDPRAETVALMRIEAVGHKEKRAASTPGLRSHQTLRLDVLRATGQPVGIKVAGVGNVVALFQVKGDQRGGLLPPFEIARPGKVWPAAQS